MKKNVLIISIIIFLPFKFFAQDKNHETNLEGEHHFHHNHVALFTGASTILKEDNTNFTLGVDYTRYFSPECNFAVGIYTEAIFAHHTEWILGAVLVYEITENFWIHSGPGVEILQEDIGHTGKTESKTEFLFRVGMGYSFHFGRFSAEPSVDLDFVRSSTTLVWGVNFGMGF